MTPDIRAAAVRAVASGVRRHAALVLAGIPLGTAGKWLAIADGRSVNWDDGTPVTNSLLTFLRALGQDFARAEAERERTIIENIAKAAQTVNEKTGIPEWRAGAWLMEHGPAWKRDYAEYRELKVEGRQTVSHEYRRIQELPLGDVLELAGPDFAELVPVADERDVRE